MCSFSQQKKKREIDLIFYISESLTWKEENWREYVRPTAREPPWMSLGNIHCCSLAREKLRPTADNPPFNSRRGCSATAALCIAGGRWQASLLVACRSAAIAIDRFDRQREFFLSMRERFRFRVNYVGAFDLPPFNVGISVRASSYQRPTPETLLIRNPSDDRDPAPCFLRTHRVFIFLAGIASHTMFCIRLPYDTSSTTFFSG
jgi:hypothetical protein